jgi:hypothetical protein
MFPDIGSFLDRLQTAFGKGFVYAGVLPVMAGVGATIAITHNLFLPVREFIAWIATVSGWKSAVFSGIALFALALGGFVLWSMNSSLHQILERWGGKRWPFRLWVEPLERARRAERTKLLGAMEEQRKSVAEFRLHAPTPAERDREGAWANRLRRARQAGEAAAREKNATAEIGLPESVSKRFATFTATIDDGRPATHAEVDALVLEIEGLLRLGAPNAALDQCQIQLMSRWLTDARETAEAGLKAAVTRFRSTYPLTSSEVAPTNLGNLSAIRREYSLRQFGFDAEALWIHLINVIPADEPLRDIVSEAKLRLDVCVAFTITSLIVAVVTLFALFLAAHDVLTSFAIVMGIVLAAVGLNSAAVSASRGLTDAVRALVDQHRHAVLKAFRLPLPANSAEERERWTQVALLTQAPPSKTLVDFEA